MPHADLPTGIRIRYEERGAPDARPLVLAHGFSAGLDMWWPQVPTLSEEFRLIIWDARGHGGSSAPRDPESYTIEALTADLRGLLEILDAVDGAVIGGVSFGGQIATQYAVDYPADTYALVLSDTTTRGADAGEPIRAQEYPTWVGDPGMEGCRFAMRNRADLTEHLYNLDIPTLVIVGTFDGSILPGLHRLDGLQRKRTVRLDRCGHGTSAQRPDDWTDEVVRFIRDVEAGAPLGEDEVR
ncbi:MAG: alpha/beta fold hydrolase [Chloroflexi bacterium]|nr:alpha/beta fold hydrolase [Chloroflexota bacterium]MQC16656.1 alpha/beta fold hydrolase [Chloroflexota bacterium]